MGFLTKYNHHEFEDWGAYCSDDFKDFSSDFKKYLKSEGLNVVRHCCNHYDLFGFIEKDGKYVYYSWSWNRFSPVDIHASGVLDGALYREAESDRDYRGGMNNFCSLADLPERIRRMFT